MKNTIEIKNNIVRKTYASRMDYLREEKVYKALKGSGLAPELIDSRDGYLEHEYVEGENFLDLIKAAGSDTEKLTYYFESFCDWYVKYRNLTKMTVGLVRFEKFVFKNGQLCNLDFENCKPGFMEDDIARLAAQMCMVPVAFAEKGVELAKVFLGVCYKVLNCNPEQIYLLLPKCLKDECAARSFTAQYSKIVYISTVLTCTGVVFAGGDTDLAECSELLATMPQKLVSAPADKRGVKNEIDGFETVLSKSGINNTLGRIVDIQKRVEQVWSFYVTTDMPKIPKILIDTFFSADKEDVAAVVIEAGGKLREFPMLLNTAKTRFELESAMLAGETSITDILSGMPVKVIKLENIK